MKQRQASFALRIIIAVVSGSVLFHNNVVGISGFAEGGDREALLIKGTYIKLSLLNAAANKDDAEARQVKHDPKNDIKFRVFNIHSGPISEIWDRRLYDVTTSPSGDVIQIAANTVTFNGKKEEFVGYGAQWQVGQYTSAVAPKNITVVEALNFLGSKYADVGKYSSYEVEVQLGRQSRTYKAIAIYHTPNYSTLDLKVEFWDWIVGMGGTLNDILSDSRPIIGSRPVISDEANNRNDNAKEKGHNSGKLNRSFSTVFECDNDQPICCPQDAASLTACCWNPKYAYSNPGIVSDCANKKSTSKDDQASLTEYRISSFESATTCLYNTDIGPPEIFSDRDTSDHLTGYHSVSANLQTYCRQQSDCWRSCRVVVNSKNYYETPLFLSVIYLFHHGKPASIEERGQGKENKIACKRSEGYGTFGCFIPYCGGSVSISLPTNNQGPAVGVEVSGGDLWNKGFGLVGTCTFIDGGGSGGGCTPDLCLPGEIWVQRECRCRPKEGSPIVIDISRYWDWATNSGNGYGFTNVTGGVQFDLNADGVKEQVAWPTATSENAWLVLDRNGNGIVDNGSELFGDFTPQPTPPPEEYKNGWFALAELDKGSNGGNDNGSIDRGDGAFPNLRLWVDRNHNGISEQNELIPLGAIGITGIWLNYQTAPWTDQYGNQFRYKARFQWGDFSDPEFGYVEWYKDAWDVFPQWIP